MGVGPLSTRPQWFGKYLLLAKLATGGMGEIFLARLTGLGGFEKVVVIKRLLPHLAEDSHFVAMFLDEARLAARLSHPNVCSVYELGEVDGQYFIAMEYLQGATVSRIIRRAGAGLLDMRLVCGLIHQACEGLHHAHELTNNNGEIIGVVHRDVSPSNLFATTNGTVKVLDFGIAKAQGALATTRTGTLKGKYAYMSPEQLLSKPLDRRSDIFALGVVMFEGLTGRRLFHRDSDFLIFRAITEEPLPRVGDYRDGVPEALAQVLTRALSRDTRARYQSAREFGEAIAEASASIGGLMPAHEVADFLQTACAKLLAEQRALLDNADGLEEAALLESSSGVSSRRTDIAPSRPPGQEDGDTEPEAAPTRVDKGSGAQAIHRKVSAPTASHMALSPEVGRKGSRGTKLLLGVCAVLIAALVVVVVRGFAQETSVVVIEREPLPPPRAKVVEPDPPDKGGVVPTTDAGTNRTKVRIRSGRDPLSYAVNRKAAALKACMIRYPADARRFPKVELRYSIDKSGKPTEVLIRLPRRARSGANVATTPLGQCLRRVARTVRFGKQSSSQSFVLPLTLTTVHN